MMKSKGNRILNTYVFPWGAVLVLSICFLMLTIQANHASGTEESKANLASKSKTPAPKIPAIDEAAPSIFDTASFGLG